MEDIERHLEGRNLLAVVPERVNLPQWPVQKRLLEALTAPDDDTLEGYYRRRYVAVDAIVAYCTVEEGRTVQQRATQAPSIKGTLPGPDYDSPKNDPLFQAMMSVFVKREKGRQRRYLLCIGAARRLESDDPQFAGLLREFYTSSDLTKHFRRRNLKLINKDENLECQVCELTLDHKMHLKNHARRVHSTVS